MDTGNLSWKEGPSPRGGFFYYFPHSMALIEHDEHFGRFLRELQQCGGDVQAVDFSAYPEGYGEDTIANLAILEKRGLLTELHFPGIPSHVPLARLIIANTMRCNLVCRYCYNRFSANSPGLAQNDMSVKTFHRCVESLEEASAALPHVELCFIGGEPLLHPEILDEAAKWGEKLRKKGKELFISATTNATLLTGKMAEFCRRRQIHLKLTVDGTAEEHDCSRVFPGGRGSFQAIKGFLPGFFSTISPKARYAATTINTRESDPLERVITLSAMGFTVIDLVELYSREGIMGGGREPCGGGEAPEHQFAEKYRRLLEWLLEKVQQGIYLHVIPVYDLVRNLHHRRPAFLRCRAGGDSLAVSPDGTIYACHHFFGDGRFALGNVRSALPSSLLAPYRVPVGERPGCSACWARLFCGGPCFHRSLVIAGDAFPCVEVECIRIRALVQEVIGFYLRLRNEENQPLGWFLEQGAYR
ncbi:MAG: radical SAM protein [Candidatus Eremiobacteraeota bacterium]|nr:radical SAM protein [Candidatus Eremiobacteraeota bacterium]